MSAQASKAKAVDEESVKNDAAQPLFPFADDTLLQPISKSDPAGEDPRYDDTFAALRAQLELISGTDFPRVVKESRSLLSETAKDMRVLGYLVLATLVTEGLRGLPLVLDSGAAMLDRFGDDCHPRRAKARLNAVRWFDSDRFEELLFQADFNDDRQLHADLEASADRFRQLLNTWLPDDERSLSALKRWVDKKRPKEEPRKEPEKGSGPAAKAAPASAASAASDNSPGPIGSERDFLRNGRSLIEWMLEQDNWAGAVAQARLLRWSTQALPPAEDNRTRIPAPRGNAVEAVQTAMGSSDWKSAFQKAEAAFMEPGGHLLFGLQRLAHQAVTRAGRPEVARMIEVQTEWLLDRHAELENLCFECGRPFFDEADREWLNEFRGGSDQASSGAGEADAFAECEREAAEIGRKDGLAAAMQHIDSIPARPGRDAGRKDLAKARMAARFDKPALALAICSDLIDRLQEASAGSWDADFGGEVAALALRLIASVDKNQFPSGRDPAQWRAELRALIVRASPERALSVF